MANRKVSGAPACVVLALTLRLCLPRTARQCRTYTIKRSTLLKVKDQKHRSKPSWDSNMSDDSPLSYDRPISLLSDFSVGSQNSIAGVTSYTPAATAQETKAGSPQVRKPRYNVSRAHAQSSSHKVRPRMAARRRCPAAFPKAAKTPPAEDQPPACQRRLTQPEQTVTVQAPDEKAPAQPPDPQPDVVAPLLSRRLTTEDGEDGTPEDGPTGELSPMELKYGTALGTPSMLQRMASGSSVLTSEPKQQQEKAQEKVRFAIVRSSTSFVQTGVAQITPGGQSQGLYTVVVGVLQGKNMIKLDRNSESDPYVVARIGKLEASTRTIMDDPNPPWNEVFVFDVAAKKGHMNLFVDVCSTASSAWCSETSCSATTGMRLETMISSDTPAFPVRDFRWWQDSRCPLSLRSNAVLEGAWQDHI